MGSYASWAPRTSDQPSFAAICIGVSGIIYPPALLDALRDEGEAFMVRAPRADDIWVHAVAVRHGIRTRQVHEPQTEFPAIPGTQIGTLYRQNVTLGGNDEQIARTHSADVTELIIADHRHGRLSADRRPSPPAPVPIQEHADRAIGNGYPAFIAFFTGPILAQGLGVDGRGWVATATAPIALVTTAATFGVPEAVSYVVARHRGLARAAGRRGLLLLALAGLLAAVAVVFAAPFLSGGRPEVVQLIYIASIAIIPSLMVSVLRGVASAIGRWTLVTTERMLSSTFRLLVLLPFYFTHSLTPLVATIAVAAIPVVGGTVYLRILRKGDVEVPELVDEAKYRGILRYGSRVWIGSISGILLSRLDQTLLTPLAGTFELGLYVVAVSISELPLIINSAVRDVTFVTDAAKRDDERLAASARISTLLAWWRGPSSGPACSGGCRCCSANRLATPSRWPSSCWSPWSSERPVRSPARASARVGSRPCAAGRSPSPAC